MTAEIVNLRKARKEKARSARDREADQNRRLHGRTAAEKKKEAAERERAKRHVAEHRLDPDKD